MTKSSDDTPWAGFFQACPFGRPIPGNPLCGVHIVRMRWGKIVEIDANEDSEAVASMLKKQAAAGVEEAMAPGDRELNA